MPKSAASESIAANMVVDDVERGLFRVNRRAFTDPDILKAEQELIFERCWLYVGHESEIPERGSFVKRKVAGRQMIMLRDDEGQVRIFFDTCPHRGNSICPSASGTAQRFTCFYHAWTFSLRGDLIGLPDPEGYSDAFRREDFKLAGPARVESYRGLVFMCLDPNVVSLSEYLGGAKEYIDLQIDFTDHDVVVAPGQQSYSIKANWKLLLENSADIYHGPITHQRYFVDYIRDIGGDPSKWRSSSRVNAPDGAMAFPYGHSVVEIPLGGLPLNVEGAEHLSKIRAGMVAKFGERYTHRALDYSRNLLIFPNLAFVSNFRTIRTFYPTSPDYMEVNAWAMVGDGEPSELRELRLNNFSSFLGPGGFGTPDDIEALENCQRGYAATEAAWSDISRGMKREGGAIANDELQMRSLWRRWYAALNPAYTPPEEQGRTLVS